MLTPIPTVEELDGLEKGTMRVIALPKNRKLQGVLLVATIAILIAYSWLAARTLEPRFELPTDVIRASVWVSESTVFSLHEVQSPRWRELARVSSEVSTAASALRWLSATGRPLEPLDLVIRGVQSDRLNVTGSRIEISPDVLMARGQLTKAILKSYLLQRGSIDLISSHLRLDVASDVLLAMTSGGLDLEVPGHEASLHFEPILPWWTYAKTYRGVCESNWRSIELLPLCRAKDSGQPIASMSSFRPLLGAIVWNAFAAQPVAQRYAFAQKWARSLSRLRAAELKSATRVSIREEVEALLPKSDFPEAATSIKRSMEEARIEQPSLLEADLLVRKVSFDDRDHGAIETLLHKRPGLLIFARTDDGLVTYPGGVMVDSKDLQVRKVKNEVYFSCESPKLKEIAKREAPTTRLLWVRQCGDEEAPLVYGPLLAVGMEGFARSNPNVTFVQLRPDAVAFALRTGHAQASDGVEKLVSKESAKADEPWFGLSKATWINAASAYKVTGAIEAVEWHRVAKAPGEKISNDF